MDKICGTCKQPKSTSDFHRSSNSKDGYKSRCKQCKRQEQDNYVLSRGGKLRVSARLSLLDTEKFCTKCETVMDKSLFGGATSSWCISCRKSAAEQERRELGIPQKRKRKPELHALGLRECFICNEILPVNLFTKTKRGDNGLRPYCIECDKTQGRDHAKSNREIINTYLRSRYRKTDNYKRYHRHETHLRRAIQKTSDIDAVFLKDLYGRAECFYCGKVTVESNRTADHVTPLSLLGAHTKANLVMACSKCNFVKGYRPIEYLMGRLPETRRKVVYQKLWDMKQGLSKTPSATVIG